jgi:NAD(P)-dependent dehydrogenase (short-subunit alcohol dehydrogenase family)
MAIPAESKVALIIGAGTALGAEIARGLASSGMQLALNDQLPTRIEPLAAEIAAGGGQAAAFPADVSRKLSLQTMLQDVLEKYARIDILVFVAGTQPDDALLDMDEWDWHRTIDLNLTAAFLCMQSVGRVMRELGGGVIVNVVNVPGPTSNVKSDSAAYAVAAAGVEALSRTAGKEFAAHGIRVHVARSAEEALQILNAA